MFDNKDDFFYKFDDIHKFGVVYRFPETDRIFDI